MCYAVDAIFARIMDGFQNGDTAAAARSRAKHAAFGVAVVAAVSELHDRGCALRYKGRLCDKLRILTQICPERVRQARGPLRVSRRGLLSYFNGGLHVHRFAYCRRALRFAAVHLA